MKRLRVSDIEALLGPEAAARLVEGVKGIRGRQTYVIEVDALFKTRELVEAKSAVEARQIAEKRVDVTWESNPTNDSPVRPFLKSRVVVQEPVALALGTVLEAEITKTAKVAAKGPGSTPRPKRKLRPSRD